MEKCGVVDVERALHKEAPVPLVFLHSEDESGATYSALQNRNARMQTKSSQRGCGAILGRPASGERCHACSLVAGRGADFLVQERHPAWRSCVVIAFEQTSAAA
jgi:hypothetical protein